MPMAVRMQHHQSVPCFQSAPQQGFVIVHSQTLLSKLKISFNLITDRFQTYNSYNNIKLFVNLFLDGTFSSLAIIKNCIL